MSSPSKRGSTQKIANRERAGRRPVCGSAIRTTRCAEGAVLSQWYVRERTDAVQRVFYLDSAWADPTLPYQSVYVAATFMSDPDVPSQH